MSTANEVERLDLGRVTHEALRVLRRRFVLLFLLAFLLAGLPIALLANLQVRGLQAGGGVLPTLNMILGSLLAGAAASAAITHVIARTLAGEPTSLTDALTSGFRRFAEVSVASLVVFVATGIGLVAVIVPGLMIATAWMVVVPVTVVERRKLLAAIERSQALTRGNRLLLAALILVYTALVTGVALATAGPNPDPASYPTGPLQVLLDALQSTFSQLVSIVGVTVVYAELRRIHDGAAFDVAEVFD